jgi:hypothetical protein
MIKNGFFQFLAALYNNIDNMKQPIPELYKYYTTISNFLSRQTFSESWTQYYANE